ncbi:hypothetical protein Godav_011673 [Gossypium davidsonii]|uniref:Uncharacterized protein n=1 Tax=Gossypium davidsonii TaxID=34287 RepID=A0A7J8RAU5_GOSDV|nr:hypothetical protein [Gossypium davidsonii]
MLKAKPNLELKIRTLKRDWAIVYTCSVENTITTLVETSIDSLLLNILFPYYDQLTVIYTKDQVTGKDAQTTADIIEEIDSKDVATANTHEERNDFHGCEPDVSLDEMDLSTTLPQPSKNQDDSTFSKKKKKKISDASEQISSTSFTDSATLLAKNIRTAGLQIRRSIASEVLIQQNSQKWSFKKVL